MRKKELIKYQQDVLDTLFQLPTDKDKPFLVSNQITYNINDVIREVESLSDFGMKFIRSQAGRNN